jgi:hypothetical protein
VFNIDRLQKLKVNTTDAAKLFNWNILAKEIEMLGIQISNDQKRVIIEGDFDSITDVLLQLKEVLHGDINSSVLVNKDPSNNKETGYANIHKNEKKKKGGKRKGDEKENEETPPKESIPKTAIDIELLETEKNANESNN